MDVIVNNRLADVALAGPVKRPKINARFRVEAKGGSFRVQRMWETGFAVKSHDAPVLRGLVDLYDGKKHLGLCLVSNSRDLAGETHYDMKRIKPFAQEAALALERSAARPLVLITDAISDFQ